MQEAERVYPHDPSEQLQIVLPRERRQTVAEYLLWKLHTVGLETIHTLPHMQLTPLQTTIDPPIQFTQWPTPEKVFWATTMHAKYQGFGAIYFPENLLSHVFEGLLQASNEMMPLVFILRRSLAIETKEVCGLPLSQKEYGMQQLQDLIQQLAAKYITITDRRIAATQIDKTLDVSLELLQPVVIELPDEVAQAYIPLHTYKKTVFNYEENEQIDQTWETIFSRIEQAQNPLFIIGQQCWPPMWHEILLNIASYFQVPVIASEFLWGHLSPNNCSIRYTPLSPYNRFKEFDSLFIFGVPADHPWLETMVLHHEFHAEQELFFLHATGTGFGNGQDAIAAPHLQEFFGLSPWKYHTPHNDPPSQMRTPWYSIASMMQEPYSPLFIENNSLALQQILQYYPFAKICIQPQYTHEQWFAISTKSWAQLSPNQILLLVGSTDTLCPIFQSPEFRALSLLFLFTNEHLHIDGLVSQLHAHHIANEYMLKAWIEEETTPKRGIIHLDPLWDIEHQAQD